MNHDILETYTARGLLGTVIVRRLASRAQPLPEAVPDVFAALIRCALIRCADRGQVSESGSLDLDVQDELAPAAEMLRVVESSSRTPESSTRSEPATPTPPSPRSEARPTTASAT